ncbi:LysR family transcriptional regulator [Hwanghaeella sp.]|uniref:LysR family transcriptional regulator n=1 Tax=Hwanghaeella sp. TaxID=2605943 RepID=UPI003CCBD063
MNLRHLRTFVTIAETGSFQAASERLFLTQSAVSMQMKALEESLQAELFDRGKRPPVLSALGRALLDRARDLVDQVDSFRQAAAGGEELLGSLTLGVIPSATTSVLPSALARLRDEHPRMQVRIEGGLSAGLEDLVAGGVIDAAVITEPARLPSGLRSLTIFSEPLLIAAPKNAEGESGPDMLETLPFIRFNRGTGVGRIIETTLQSRHIRVAETMELDSIEAILMMVSRGLGAAVVPHRSLTPQFAETVRTFPFDGPAVMRNVGLVVRRRQSETPLVTALYSALCFAARDAVRQTRESATVQK